MRDASPKIVNWLRRAASVRSYVPAPKQLLDHRLAASLRLHVHRLAVLGTEHYPPDVQRRLMILNLIAYLIAATTVIYAVQYALLDPVAYGAVIAINLAMVAAALLVPLAHRVSDIAGGLLIVGAEYIALMAFIAYLGRTSGIHLQYFVAAAAPFVVFGLERLWLILVVVSGGLVLHLAAWFYFPHESALIRAEAAMLDSLYVQAAVTTVALVAASVWYAFRLAERARAETDALLRNILPGSIVERLKARPGEVIADSFDNVSVLFADLRGFVPLTSSLGAPRTVALLNEIVRTFDDLAARHEVEKIKTIGDAYMVAAGLPEPSADHARRLAEMGLDMLAAVACARARTGLPLDVRIGMACGPVLAGVIGTKKFSYDVWGDTVNLAARLQEAGEPGRIHVSAAVRAGLACEFEFETRGAIDVRGVGKVEAWFLVGPAAGRTPHVKNCGG